MLVISSEEIRHGYAPENCLHLINRLGLLSEQQEKAKMKIESKQTALDGFLGSRVLKGFFSSMLPHVGHFGFSLPNNLIIFPHLLSTDFAQLRT